MTDNSNGEWSTNAKKSLLGTASKIFEMDPTGSEEKVGPFHFYEIKYMAYSLHFFDVIEKIEKQKDRIKNDAKNNSNNIQNQETEDNIAI